MYQWHIFTAVLDPVRGSEQAGQRPVIVVSRESNNQVLPVVNVVPLTSVKSPQRKIYPNEALLPAGTGGIAVDSLALCYQIRTLDKGRLMVELGEVFDRKIRSQIMAAL
ncbi:MAG: type II toxin-antitoxin system PemK/MazF family toxin, partial [Chloroflexi bacterium]|nr:type II toxin-antitoxin system PemK/MazF family toxin [Chloroflexota bacterium]